MYNNISATLSNYVYIYIIIIINTEMSDESARVLLLFVSLFLTKVGRLKGPTMNVCSTFRVS